jgi:putative transposase
MALRQNGSTGLRAEQASHPPEDLLREMLRGLVQETIQQEFDTFMGAGTYERSPERRGWRNGSKPRRLKTRVGTLELRIPKDREGRFQPSLFERYERSEKALVAALIEMYVQGVSTRKVSKVVAQLCGHTISASAVSAVTKRLDTEVEAWRSRSLAGRSYPYLIIDAHYERVRREGRVMSTAALWVIGVSEDGYREHLGLWTGASESLQSWGAVMEDLVKRGLTGVRYMVSDEHQGLVQSLRRYFPEAEHQRCTVHYLRNVRSQISSKALQQEVQAALKDCWAAPDRAEAEARLHRLLDRLRSTLPRLAEWLEETFGDTLAFFSLPAGEHRRRLKTTNSVEHDHAEVRRRSRVVRIFPNEPALIRLLGALAMERNEQWLERRYLTFEDHEAKETLAQVA